MPRERSDVRDKRDSDPKHCLSYWCVHRQHIRSSLDHYLWLDHHIPYLVTSWEPSWSSCFSTAPVRAKGAGAGMKGRSHLKSGASLDLTLRPSAPTIWDQGLDLPLIGDGPWAEGHPCPNPGSGSSTPPSSAPHHTKVIATSTPWCKMWLVFMSNPALLPKPLGTGRLYRDAST